MTRPIPIKCEEKRPDFEKTKNKCVMKINSTINLTPAYKIRKEKTSQTYRQCVVPALLHELLLLLEDLPDGPGDDPALRVLLKAGSPLHGVGLAAASLSVGEHTDVVAVQRGLKENVQRRT